MCFPPLVLWSKCLSAFHAGVGASERERVEIAVRRGAAADRQSRTYKSSRVSRFKMSIDWFMLCYNAYLYAHCRAGFSLLCGWDPLFARISGRIEEGEKSKSKSKKKVDVNKVYLLPPRMRSMATRQSRFFHRRYVHKRVAHHKASSFRRLPHSAPVDPVELDTHGRTQSSAWHRSTQGPVRVHRISDDEPSFPVVSPPIRAFAIYT